MKNIIKIMILISLGAQSIAFALPNPAATNCISKGNKYLLVNNIGVCVFPDNSYCEEWAYFRGQCRQGQNHPVVGSSLPNAATKTPPTVNGSTPP